jgi:hypothetical protein
MNIVVVPTVSELRTKLATKKIWSHTAKKHVWTLVLRTLRYNTLLHEQAFFAKPTEYAKLSHAKHAVKLFNSVKDTPLGKETT